MPVTVQVSDKSPEGIQSWMLETDFDNPNDFLDCACDRAMKERLCVVQTSFQFTEDGPSPAPVSNGLFYSLLCAYNWHHHLRLRADDIWIAALTQFGSYVKAHSEELRSFFVDHKDKNELAVVYENANRYTVDYDDFAAQTAQLMRAGLADVSLFDWMMPNFSTTTQVDSTVASIVMLSTMQDYFGLNLITYCGVPSVTLLAERADYEKLLHKVESFDTYGGEVVEFGALLQPIVRRMIRTFDDPTDPDVVDFWARMMDKQTLRSGQTIYSGWATAFCFWNKDGQRLAKPPLDVEAQEQERAIPKEGSGKPKQKTGTNGGKLKPDIKGIELDSVQYHVVDINDVPPGWSSVPIKCRDLAMGDELELRLFAGSLGISCTGSSCGDTEGKIVLNTVQPAQGWIVCESEERHKASGEAAPF